MLGVLAVLAYLYLSAGVHLLGTWREARDVNSKVTTMEHEHELLQRQHESLGKPGTIEAQARRLGMMKHGEQPYIISNLPND